MKEWTKGFITCFLKISNTVRTWCVITNNIKPSCAWHFSWDKHVLPQVMAWIAWALETWHLPPSQARSQAEIPGFTCINRCCSMFFLVPMSCSWNKPRSDVLNVLAWQLVLCSFLFFLKSHFYWSPGLCSHLYRLRRPPGEGLGPKFLVSPRLRCRGPTAKRRRQRGGGGFQTGGGFWWLTLLTFKKAMEKQHFSYR